MYLLITDSKRTIDYFHILLNKRAQEANHKAIFPVAYGNYSKVLKSVKRRYLNANPDNKLLSQRFEKEKTVRTTNTKRRKKVCTQAIRTRTIELDFPRIQYPYDQYHFINHFFVEDQSTARIPEESNRMLWRALCRTVGSDESCREFYKQSTSLHSKTTTWLDETNYL